MQLSSHYLIASMRCNQIVQIVAIPQPEGGRKSDCAAYTKRKREREDLIGEERTGRNRARPLDIDIWKFASSNLQSGLHLRRGEDSRAPLFTK